MWALNDAVVSASTYTNEDMLTIITSKGTGKRVKLSEFEQTSRGRKGVLVVRDVKTNPYYIFKAFIIDHHQLLVYKTKDDFKELKITELPIADRYSTGTQFTKQALLDVFIARELENPNVKKEKVKEPLEEVKEEAPKEVSLKSVDERIMTIDDFLDNFNI